MPPTQEKKKREPRKYLKVFHVAVTDQQSHHHHKNTTQATTTPPETSILVDLSVCLGRPYFSYCVSPLMVIVQPEDVFKQQPGRDESKK